MREILEDAAIVYRQEAESLLIVAAPAVVLGPVCVLIATSGFRAALISVPALLLLYLFVYCASLRAAKLVLESEEPDPGVAYVSMLVRTPALVIACLPVALAFGAVAASSLVISNEGYTLAAFGLGVFGAFMALIWTAQHAYDLPLVMAYGLGGFDALRAGRNVLESAPGWTYRLFAVTTLPLVIVAVLCWTFWVLLSPPFGAAVFAAAAAVWLPFAALAFAGACSRLVSRERPAENALAG